MFAEQKGKIADLSGNFARLVVPRVESRVLTYRDDLNTRIIDLINGDNGFFAIRIDRPLKSDICSKLYADAENHYPNMKALICEIGGMGDYPTSISRILFTRDNDLIVKIGEKISHNSKNRGLLLNRENGILSIFCLYPYFQSAQEIVDYLNDAK